MQYKTTIEIVTEADSEHEAADIAGEFLKGNFTEAADIKVKTVSVARLSRIHAILAICAISALFGAVVIYNNVSYKIAKMEMKPATSYAIQPPLKTNLDDMQNNNTFKADWEKEYKKRFNSIAR